MKLQRRWLAAAVSSAVVAVSAIAITSSGVSAAGTVDPAITNDPNAANGTIAFYDAAGNQITSGPLSKPFAPYAVASTDSPRGGTIKATLFVATPDHTKSNSATWFNQGLTAASNFPLTTAGGAPAGVVAAEGSHPAVAIAAGDGDLGGAFAGAVNDPTTGYDHVMQIRLEDAGVGKPYGLPFWATDVYIDTTAGTWTQLYPAVATKTSTALSTPTATPASPGAHGATVTLSSTLTAGDSSHPAGSVHLFDGSTDKGAATFTAGTGAVSATDTPADGAHSYSFKFTPTDTSTYAGSSSATLSYTVNGATATTTTVTADPASPSTSGQSVTFTATVSPTAAGTVQFKDGSTNLGSPVTVSGGSASYTTTALSVATHSITAVFSSTDSGFSGSTSAALSYKVNPLPATATTTALTVTPAGPVDFGTSVSLAATVTPSNAAGSVQFLDGSTLIGSPVAVSGGSASTTISTLDSGVHSLTAKFIPTDATVFGASTSAASSLTVNAQTTTTALTVSPASPVNAGTKVTLKAALTPTTATGTVQFLDGATAIGTPVTVTAGLAQTSTTTLSVASHSLTAQFTPTSTAKFTASTSAASTLVVQNPPPGSTTTSLGVTPAGPIVSGSSATLKATIAPATATGTVQFMDGMTAVGMPVTVAGGSASTSVTPAIGTHSYTAVYTSSDTTKFLNSTSGEVSLVVKAPATKTATTLTASPTGAQAYGTAVTFTATVSPVTPGDPAPTGGTVNFLDGSTKLGSVTLTGGKATLTSKTLASGSHSVTAMYLPTDATVFTASTSAAVKVTINARATTAKLTSVPVGKTTAGKAVTFITVVTPGVAGKVSFADGTKSLGLIPVVNGRARVTTAKLAVGKHSVVATFVPTSTTAWLKSRSDAVVFSVTAAPKAAAIGSVTAGGVAVGSGATLTPGTSITLHASGFTAGETVTAVLHSTPVTLGTTTADAGGNVAITVTLPSDTPAGQHEIVLSGASTSASFAITVQAAASSAPTSSASSSDPGTGSTGSTGSTGGGLASTGAVLYPVLGLGGLLLLVGLALITGARRRRAH